MTLNRAVEIARIVLDRSETDDEKNPNYFTESERKQAYARLALFQAEAAKFPKTIERFLG